MEAVAGTSVDDLGCVKTCARRNRVEIGPLQLVIDKDFEHNQSDFRSIRENHSTRHSPDDIQICGNRTTGPPPRERHSFRSHPIA